MNFSNLIESIERFFLDVVGTILPGSAVGFLLWRLADSPTRIEGLFSIPPVSTFDWVIEIGVCYILGHSVVSLGQILVSLVLDPVLLHLRKNILFARIVPHCRAEGDLMISIAESDAFRLLRLRISNSLIIPEDGNWGPIVHELRNSALSIISNEKHVVSRFMFISLLNLGMSCALLIFLLCVFGNFLLSKSGWISNVTPISNIILLLSIVLAVLFLERRYSFYDRAMRVPFPMALATLRAQSCQPNSPERTLGNLAQAGPSAIVVYLAGGFHSSWQDLVIASNPLVRFLDPRDHGLQEDAAYTMWDLHAIEKCDIVFAYLELNNPGGYALSLEIGYARALNKRILFVDDWRTYNDPRSRYLEMVRECADVVFDNLEAGALFLCQLTSIRGR